MHAVLTALAALWPYVPSVLIIAIGAAALRLKTWRASPAAEKHPTLAYVADVGGRVAADALAELRGNAAVTPTQMLVWGVGELKALLPDIVTNLGADASDAALEAMVRRSMLDKAQAGVLDGVARAVIAELRPGLTTVLAALPSPTTPTLVVPPANSVSGGYHGL